jgi:hypothetical protein
METPQAIETIVSKELDYRPYSVNEPFYSYTRIFPQSGSTTTTINAGGNDTIFELPPTKAYNLAKSWFDFSITTPHIDNRDIYIFADFIPFFRQIQVYTRGGLFLMDLNDAHLHSKMTMKINKKMKDTLNTSITGQDSSTGSYSPCFSSNNQVTDISSLRYDGTQSNKNYTEPSYLLNNSTTNGVDINIHVTIYFKEIWDTILSIDHDIIFNETILIRFVWNTLNNVAFSAPEGPPPNPTNNNPAVLANPITVYNMQIKLAVEENLSITSGLLSKIASPEGFSLIIPYTYSNSISLTGTSNTVTLRVNRANGLTLDKIYHSVFAAYDAASPNLAVYDNDDINAVKVQAFYTNLNNQKMNQYDFYITEEDDYKILKHILHDSTIQSSNIYYYNWVWVQLFRQGTIMPQYNSDNIIQGIDLNQGEQKWDFVATVAAPATNYNHQSFIVCKRKLVITSAGIVLN